MRDRLLTFGREALTGQSRGPAATVFRAATSVVEPFYSAVTTARNIAYDRRWLRSFDLGRPTISVGNITTGGTGKTPVVKWLADRLRQAGHRPAILMRGYAATDGQSDEQQLLHRALNSDPSLPTVPVIANPSRIAGGATALSADPSISHFTLDDGFQHRRARRNFDLVLINATDPFGGRHVLPRGLLREPLRGLSRASAFLITRASMVSAETIQSIEQTLRTFGPPIFQSDHVSTLDPQHIAGKKVVAVSAIGDPESFEKQLTAAGAIVTDRIRFADHHRYTPIDIAEIRRRAGDTPRVTTEKDWVKIEPIIDVADKAAWIVSGVSIQMHGDDDTSLFNKLTAKA